MNSLSPNGAIRCLMAACLSLLMLSGCSMIPTWIGGDGGAVEEDIPDFVEPNPGAPVGLQRIWGEDLTDAPDKFMGQPRTMVADGGDLFIGSYEGALFRVRQSDGDVVWRAELDAPIIGGVALDDQRIYAGTDEGEMVALDRNDGHEVWRQRVSSKVASAPRVAGGKVLFVTLDNHTWALNAISGERLWMHKVPPEPLVITGAPAPSVLSNEVVFTGYASGEVFALSLDKGRVLWTDSLTRLGGRTELDLIQDINADIVATPQRVYAVNHQGHLRAYLPGNGSRLWSQRMSANRTPLVRENVLYLADVEGSVHAIDANEGGTLWSTRVSDGVLTAPVLFGDRLLLADDRFRMVALDPLSGRVLGLDRLADPVMTDLLVADGHLFMLTNDGTLYRFD